MSLFQRILSGYLVSSALLSNTRFGVLNHTSTCSNSSMASHPYSISYVTIGNIDDAKTLARKLVDQSLVACVNIIPGITSIYKWKGKVEEDQEYLLLIKTKTSRLEEMTNFIRQNHPYEVCEVISLPIQQGNQQYLDWISTVVPDK